MDRTTTVKYINTKVANWFPYMAVVRNWHKWFKICSEILLNQQKILLFLVTNYT